MEERRSNWRRKCEEAGFPVTSNSSVASSSAHSSQPMVEGNLNLEVNKQNLNLSSSDLESQRPLPPKNDVLTFIASLNISLPMVSQVIQEMLDNYEVWHRVSNPAPTASNQVAPSTNTLFSSDTNQGTDPISQPEAEIPPGAWGILQEGSNSNGNSSSSNNSGQNSPSSSNAPKTPASPGLSNDSDLNLGILKRLENMRERRRLKLILERGKDSEDVDGNYTDTAAGGKEDRGNPKFKKRKGDQDGGEKLIQKGKNSKGKRK